MGCCDGSIKFIGSSPVVEFAALELAKHLEKTCGRAISIKKADTYDSGDICSLWVGLSDDIGGLNMPKVADPEWDDAVYVETSGLSGVIAGNNPRSTLQAVYRYLRELGWRWVRPSEDGERVPKIECLSARSVCVAEAASSRHRGICIEGSVSYENLKDTIDWMPKVGFNSYFTQFRESFTFFDRWYSHENNPAMLPEKFTVEDARRFLDMATDEMKLRGLIYHAVGHGWTCEPIGVPGLGWEKMTEAIPDETREMLAMVDGKRDFFGGVALNTNLCTGNPKVRQLMVDDIVKYLTEHPKVDVLHFWLADGVNNTCECDLCKDTSPADFYVMMLNDLDSKLTRAGIDAKVVFLIYLDLMWPPEKEKIANPDRFKLMFAPISRTWSVPFDPYHPIPAPKPFVRNKLALPSDVQENLSFLREWEKLAKFDTFDFDYHLMWAHVKDPGYCDIAAVLHRDAQVLGDIGLDGFMSCQVQRCWLPSGLPMIALGRTLWDKTLTMDEIESDYFSSAFGEDGDKARAYLHALSDLFDLKNLALPSETVLLNAKSGLTASAAVKLSGIASFIDSYRAVMERNLCHPDPCVRASWEYLKEHADIASLLARAFGLKARGFNGPAKAMYDECVALARTKEMKLQKVFDVWIFQIVFDGVFQVAEA